MKKNNTLKTVILLLAALLLSAGCKTVETQPVSRRRQAAFFANVRDPRIYGLHIYQTPAGIEYRGGGRVHPNQIEVRPMGVKRPLRPVVMMTGNFDAEWPVLLDFTALQSWFEFSTAQELGAQPVGEHEAQMVRLPNEKTVGYLSVVSALRFGQLHISSPLICVRMADGPLGALARGIEKPAPNGVVGWDLLRKLKQIQLDYSAAQVLLSTVEAYAPDPQQIVAELPLVQHAGACAVRGSINGRDSLIFIDPAGDFEFATGAVAAVSRVQLGETLVFEHPAVSASPGGARLGARLLQNYKITVCPQAGMIYFEKPDSGKGQ